MTADMLTMLGLLVLIVVVLRALRAGESTRRRPERRLGRRHRRGKSAGGRGAGHRPKRMDQRGGPRRRVPV